MLEKTGPDWTLITPKGRICAAKVILANNGDLKSFGFARRRLMHVFLYASMTIELHKNALSRLGGPSRWGITPSDPMGTTMRRIDTAQGGNRIVTRTCASYSPGMVTSQAAVERASKNASPQVRRSFPDNCQRADGIELGRSPLPHLERCRRHARARARPVLRLRRQWSRHRSKHADGHSGGRSGDEPRIENPRPFPRRSATQETHAHALRQDRGNPLFPLEGVAGGGRIRLCPTALSANRSDQSAPLFISRLRDIG
ncbi:hypothetical protein [Pararhizobium sp. O133]|uniref:hypothetical protein n=1 Tax=Pararhizobium sp. O133 TaxID=3449278 RepID=UPI003F6831D3